MMVEQWRRVIHTAARRKARAPRQRLLLRTAHTSRAHKTMHKRRHLFRRKTEDQTALVKTEIVVVRVDARVMLARLALNTNVLVKVPRHAHDRAKIDRLVYHMRGRSIRLPYRHRSVPSQVRI